MSDTEKYLNLASEAAVRCIPFCFKMWASSIQISFMQDPGVKIIQEKWLRYTTVTSIGMMHGLFLAENLRNKVSQ